MYIVTSSSVNKLSNMLQLDILKVNFEIFPKHFSWWSTNGRAAVEFLQLVLCNAIKTVRTMNLKLCGLSYI